MRRRDLLSAGDMAPIWATARARWPARAAGPAITAPETDFIGSLPDLQAISGVPGMFASHSNGHRLIGRVFRAVTGREHRVFLSA